jgi:hypothetical protein
MSQSPSPSPSSPDANLRRITDSWKDGHWQRYLGECDLPSATIDTVMGTERLARLTVLKQEVVVLLGKDSLEALKYLSLTLDECVKQMRDPGVPVTTFKSYVGALAESQLSVSPHGIEPNLTHSSTGVIPINVDKQKSGLNVKNDPCFATLVIEKLREVSDIIDSIKNDSAEHLGKCQIP